MIPARGSRHRGRGCRENADTGAAWSLLAAVAVVALAGSGTGCASSGVELAREQARQQSAWSALVAPARRDATRTLSWDAALEQMRGHNTKVRAADLDVSRAMEAVEQVKRSLIPTANFEAGYERLFTSGSNLSFEPFTFAGTLFFDVPGLFNYRVRYEAAVLTLTHARLVRETVWRGQVIALYRAMEEGRELQERAARLERAGSALDALAASAPNATAGERGDLAEAGKELSKRRAEWLARAGEVLGLQGARVEFSGTGVPPLPYGDPDGRPRAEQLAQLPLRLAALDLLALRARQLGITLQQWPEIDASVSSPTLYESGPGQGSYWSPRQLFAGVDALWTLDTQGRHASDKRLLAGETSYRREVLEQEAAASASKLRAALDGLARTDRKLEIVEQSLSSAGASFRPELLDARKSLLAERLDWRLTIWFFDDTQWPHVST